MFVKFSDYFHNEMVKSAVVRTAKIPGETNLFRILFSLHRNSDILRGIDTLSGEVTVSIYFCHPSEKGSTLNGKNLLPLGANSFLLE